MSQARGRAARAAGGPKWVGGGGLGLGARGWLCLAAGRLAAGRSHSSRSPERSCSVVTRRGAPGSGQGLSVAQDKRLTGAERGEKFQQCSDPH